MEKISCKCASVTLRLSPETCNLAGSSSSSSSDAEAAGEAAAGLGEDRCRFPPLSSFSLPAPASLAGDLERERDGETESYWRFLRSSSCGSRLSSILFPPLAEGERELRKDAAPDDEADDASEPSEPDRERPMPCVCLV